MEPRFYASHQVTGPNRINKNLWFVTSSEAERACDELWTAECHQEIVDTESGVFRIRGADGAWSPWGVRHPEGSSSRRAPHDGRVPREVLPVRLT
jgi:hypothetical protein